MEKGEKNIRWGILGLGNIAHKFASAILESQGGQLVSVASRNAEKAQAFAHQYGATHAHGSYASLAADPEVDVVYIATPHGRHFEDVMLCLEARKHVLCEKAFALHKQHVDAMVKKAQSVNCFLMEAIWTRFHPNFLKVKELIANETIGPLRMIRADFGFHNTYNPESRLWNPALGGGSLLDIGIYPLFLALQLMGKPDKIQAQANLSPDGIDASLAMQLQYADGRQAQLFSSFEIDMPIQAELFGPDRRIMMHNRWHEPADISLWNRNTCMKTWQFPKVSGYVYEIAHVQSCLQQGLTESPLLPLSFSQDLMETMDEIRAQVGVQYPADTLT